MTKMVGIYFYFGLQISDWQSRRRTRKDCWYFVDAGTMNYFLYCGQDCLAERNSRRTHRNLSKARDEDLLDICLFFQTMPGYMVLFRYSRLGPFARILRLNAAQKIPGSREQHCKRGSYALFALHGDGAIMSLYDGFDYKESQSGSLDICSSFETLKFGEQTGELFLRYSAPSVCHLD